MPKEMTHFALAGCLARALHQDSPFYGSVHRFPNLFLLGAIAPDIPFYYLGSRDKKAVQDLSLPFHRTDARALKPVLAFLDRKDTPPTRALSAGVVCHLMADTCFHPLVYYYAGMDGIHPGATGRHRTFETAMDIHFGHLFQGETRLNRVTAGVEISKKELCCLLAALFKPGLDLGDASPMAALRWHRRIQALFSSSWIRQGLAGLSWIRRSLPEEYTGLAYPFDQSRYLPFFGGPLVYCDPCTGEASAPVLTDMIRNTVSSAKAVLDIIAATLAEGEAEGALSHPDLPRIRPALPEKGFETWLGASDIRQLVYQGCDPLF